MVMRRAVNSKNLRSTRRCGANFMLNETDYQSEYRSNSLEFTPLDKANIELMDSWDFYISEVGNFAVTCNLDKRYRYILEYQGSKKSFSTLEAIIQFLEE
jgi:hypothetical protein